MHLVTPHIENSVQNFSLLKKLILAATCSVGLLFVGCASKPQILSDSRHVTIPDYYIVKAGDTLSAISTRYNVDYVKVAAINNISEPYLIYVNQRIRLKPSAALTAPAIQTQRLANTTEILRTKIELPIARTEPLISSNANITTTRPSREVINTIPQNAAVISPVETAPISSNSNSGFNWVKPSLNPVIQNFDFNKNIKGIRFGGKLGDAVFAAAPGQVVYADNGLKEYGNLILIKHADGYITAYAHNSKLLVNKSENVTSGQKIAEMGATGSAIVMLEFQLRLNGKPIDPRTVLNLN